MIQKKVLVALGAMSAALVACGSDTMGGPGGGGPNNGMSGASGASSGASGASGASGGASGASGGAAGTAGTGNPGGSAGVGGTGGVGGDPSTCVPGIPATSQVRRLLNRQYDGAVRDLLGVTAVGPENLPPSAGLVPDYDGPMNSDAWRLYQEVAAAIATQVMSGTNRTKFISCDPATAGCLTQTIQTFGRKAFRRPLTAAEVTSFERLNNLTPRGTPTEVAEAILYAMLVSPSFLQLNETGVEAEGTALRLSSHEVAQRLSFLLWNSVPDDILSQAADANMLTTKEQILAQAQRMIMDRAKVAPLVVGMHRNWVQMDNSLGHWWKIQHDTAKYPHYSVAAIPTYAAELDRFFEEVAFNNGQFKDLFLSNVGFVNRDNAAIYGLDPAAYGTDLQRVDLNADQRPGFMTRAGFLQSYSHFDASSPILRGAFLTQYMIGVATGPPDPAATMTPPPMGTFLTERALAEAMTSGDQCAGCHAAYINPPGFVMERYDAIGKWQDTDLRGGPIDGTATVTFSTGEKTITSPKELMTEIGMGAVPRRMYAEKWVSYTTRRDPNSNDACIVDDLNAKLSMDGYTMLQLLADLTQADSFRLRVREN